MIILELGNAYIMYVCMHVCIELEMIEMAYSQNNKKLNLVEKNVII